MIKGLSQWLVFLLVTYLVGCSTSNIVSPANTLSEPVVFNMVRGSLQLNRPLLAKRSKVRALAETEYLYHALYQSSDHRLHPDGRFEAIAAVVEQQGRDSASLYAEKLTRFLLDENFACSVPTYQRYFEQRYPSHSSTKRCTGDLPLSLISRNGEEEIVWLDPKRVSAIHLLFAGNDEGMVSRFGHVLLRLVVCPEHDRSAEACDSNLYEHITLGYRAHIDELNINTLKGLMGDYQAYLFAEEFMSSYRQYTINEFRNLYSLPLKLSERERIDLVSALAEIHWSFSGEYKFLTKNCATLLQDALRAVWPAYMENEELAAETYLRPDSFFQAMREQNLSTPDVLENLELAEMLGYFFSSTEAIYTKALNQVRSEMTQAHFESLDDYRALSPIKRYENIQHDAVYLQKLKEDEVLLGAQSLIEEYGAIKSRSTMSAYMADFFENNDMEKVELYLSEVLPKHEHRVFTECVLKPVYSLIRPKKRQKGIPTSNDLIDHQISEFDCKSDQNWDALHHINQHLENVDPSRWQPVNVAMFYWLESLNNVIRLSDLNGHL